MRPLRDLSLLLALALMGSCAAASSVLSPRCDVELGSLSPEGGAAGDMVVISGHPLTNDYDTAVYFAGTRATVLSLDRDCDDCDSCREEQSCNICGDCDSCDLICAESCVETVTVEVPAMDAGESQVRLYNGRGASNGLPFTVSGGITDTGAQDSGATKDTADTAASTDTGAGTDTAGGDTAVTPPAVH